MTNHTVFVLPGLDGSDLLLQEFVQRAPAGYDVRVLSLPDKECSNYEELANHFDSIFTSCETCTLIGESFSGPLAVIFAARHPSIVQRLVLVATFATPPVSKAIGWLPWSTLFRRPIPAIVSRLLIGQHKELLPKLRKAAASQSANTKAGRIRLVTEVNVVSQLASINCPILYLAASSDRLVRESCRRTIVNANGNVIVREIRGPHLILQTRPKECWAEIEATRQQGSSR